MRRVAQAAGIVALLYVGLAAALFVVQRQMLYIPFGAIEEPRVAGVPEMAAVRPRTSDGLDIVGWHAPPREAGAPTVVLFHGNGGHLGMRAWMARALLDAGMGVMLAGYRGYEGNAGSPSEDGLYADARAALDWLAERGVAGGDLVLYGESLGTGVAVKMASERPVAAMILQSPYTSIADVAATMFWFLPVHWLVRDRFDSLSRIAALRVPLLVVHGERDDLIPVALGRALFAAAREPKRALWIPEGGHNDLWDRVRDTVMTFAARRGL